jgi:hypothetical protein
MFVIACTRFNNETYNEVSRWRENNKYQGCIYNTPRVIKSSIPLMINIIVIEMNNSINKIIGIGLIKNTVICDKYYKIYSDGNYNRYSYKGKYRIDIDLLREKYENDKDKYSNLMNILIWIEKLEILLFKGKTHFKRGHGIQELPAFILNESIQNFNVYKKVYELFISELNIDINN